jgi:DNA polymerase III subunit delta
MSTLTREELRRSIKQGEISSVYLLFGAETYLRDIAAKVISDVVLKDAPLREFNETTFSLTSSNDIQHALSIAYQMPMMAQRRVLRITELSKLKEADEDILLRYISDPAETTVLILIADELDKRRRLTKALLDKCTSVEFSLLTDAELATWAKGRLKELKVETDERTLHHIIGLVGNSVRTLSIELDKLATASLPAGRIDIELVDKLIGRSRELSNFELTDHLISRDCKRALETLNRLLDDGTEPLMLIGLIASNYHRLALAKELMARGAPNNEVFRLVTLPFSKREEFLATARRRSSKELASCIERIAAADLAIKTSLATPRLQLEMLICELSR